MQGHLIKTHVNRGAAARMADLQGVDKSDIRRMERWNNSSMNSAYLTGLPRGIMRNLAGFPQQETFHLPINAVIPSENLQSKVFPEVSMWLNRIHEGRAEQTVSDLFARFRVHAKKYFLASQFGDVSCSKIKSISSLKGTTEN